MKKIFVLDTNILISDPRSIYQFDDNDVIIPISVIEEIDRFKKDQSEKGRNAREVSRILDRLRERGPLSQGVPILPDKKNSGFLFIDLGYDISHLPGILSDTVDNRILSVALALQKKYKHDRSVILITKDSNLRIKSDALGIPSEDFEADKVDISELYSGYRILSSTDAEAAQFESQREIPWDKDNLQPNEFVVFENRQSYGIFDSETKKIKSLDFTSENIWGIFPRNREQIFALWALMDDRIKLVTLSGGAGTGKTLLAIASGLYKTTDEDIYQKLLVARPIFAMGKDMGFLPGDLEDKLHPWMQPIYDSLDFLLGGGVPSRQKRLSKSYQELIHQGLLAVEPLTYIRGRSLPNAFFVVDESQNLTPHEVKTILTRAGEGTKIVLTGDPYQIDNPYIDATNNGLTYAIERFKSVPLAAHVTLSQGERSALASLAAEIL